MTVQLVKSTTDAISDLVPVLSGAQGTATQVRVQVHAHFFDTRAHHKQRDVVQGIYRVGFELLSEIYKHCGGPWLEVDIYAHSLTKGLDPVELRRYALLASQWCKDTSQHHEDSIGSRIPRWGKQVRCLTLTLTLCN